MNKNAGSIIDPQNLKGLPELLALRASADEVNSVYFVKPSGSSTGFHFDEIYRKAQAFAHKMQSLGIKKGDPVALVLPTCPEFFYAFFGSQIIGAIPYSIYPPLNIGKIDEWQLHTEKLLSLVQTKVVFATLQLQKILHTPVNKANVPLGCYSVKDFAANADMDMPWDFHDLAFLQYSSGSTGVPKPIAISHKAALENAYRIAQHHRKATGAKPVSVSWLPLYHDMGLVGMCFAPMIGDATLHFIRPDHFIGKPILWIKAMSEANATVTVAPNFAYGLCVRRIDDNELSGVDLSSLALVGCGAEMILPKTVDDFLTKFEKVGFNKNAFTPCYGLAEATLAVTFADPLKKVEFKTFNQELLHQEGKAKTSTQGVELASVGPCIDGVKIEIRDENEIKVPEGQVGQIWIQSPSLLTEYFNLPEETSNTLKNQWMNSEDLGFLQNEELFIVGRNKEVIILNGTNIDPSFIEQTLLNLDILRSGCSVAFSAIEDKSKQDTESLILIVESKKNNLNNEEKLKTQELVKKEVYKKTQYNVDEVVVLNPRSIPRTSSGKIKRTETKKLWLEKRLFNHNSSRLKTFLNLSRVLIKNKASSLLKK